MSQSFINQAILFAFVLIFSLGIVTALNAIRCLVLRIFRRV